MPSKEMDDLFLSSGREPIPEGIVVNAEVSKLGPSLKDCLALERFEFHEKPAYNLEDMTIEGPLFAGILLMNEADTLRRCGDEFAWDASPRA